MAGSGRMSVTTSVETCDLPLVVESCEITEIVPLIQAQRATRATALMITMYAPHV